MTQTAMEAIGQLRTVMEGPVIAPGDPGFDDARRVWNGAIDRRPADLLKPEWQELRATALQLPGCNGSDEDVLTYAMFPQVAPKFSSTRAQGPKNLGKDPNAKPAAAPAAPAATNGDKSAKPPTSYDVTLNGKTHRVTVAER